MKYLAIDPGGTSGWCVSSHHIIIAKGETGLRKYAELWRVIGSYDPILLVIESYQNTGNIAANLSPLEVIGIARLWGQLRQRPVFEQHAGNVKPFWTDEKLKALKLYMPGKPHMNDATRHMLNFITFNKGDKQYLLALRPVVNG